MNITQIHTRGFVALMSVIIISAVLLVLVFTLHIASFFSRFDALDTENKRISLGLAESCVSAVSLKIARDPHYVPAPSGDCISVGGTCQGDDPQKVCMICSVMLNGLSATADLRARYNGAYSNLRVTINVTPGNFTIVDWKEIENGDPSCVVP